MSGPPVSLYGSEERVKRIHSLCGGGDDMVA